VLHREIDVLLSRPISRTSLVMSYWLGFAMVATLLVVPTLVLANEDELAAKGNAAADPRWRYLRADERERWQRFIAGYNAEDAALAERRWPVARQIVAAMHAAGVPILAGTDAPMPGVYPGYSLHEEMALLVAGGLAPRVLAARRVVDGVFQREADIAHTGKEVDVGLREAQDGDVGLAADAAGLDHVHRDEVLGDRQVHRDIDEIEGLDMEHPCNRGCRQVHLRQVDGETAEGERRGAVLDQGVVGGRAVQRQLDVRAADLQCFGPLEAGTRCAAARRLPRAPLFCNRSPLLDMAFRSIRSDQAPASNPRAGDA
jgi:hypothetical protein